MVYIKEFVRLALGSENNSYPPSCLSYLCVFPDKLKTEWNHSVKQAYYKFFMLRADS